MDLPFFGVEMPIEQNLLLDTCVYVDGLQGRLPEPLKDVLRRRAHNHVSVCLAELVHAFGRMDPTHDNTAGVLARIEQTIGLIPAHRLATASTGVVAEAGILAGLLFRIGGLQPGQEVAALNDATIYLHALAAGQTVLTRNVRDFDLLNQILPEGRVLFYEQTP